MNRLLRALCLLLLAAFLARPAAAEGLNVDSDPKLGQAYNHARAAAAARNWPAAIAEYHRILTLQRAWVCVLPSRMGVFPGLANAVLEDLLAAPAEVWSQYEAQFGAEARTALEAAQRAEDVHAMEETAARFPLTAAARAALVAAAERSLAQGRVGEAALAWTRFCSWYGARAGAGADAATTIAGLGEKVLAAAVGYPSHLRRMEASLASLAKAGAEGEPYASLHAHVAAALANADAKTLPPWDWPTLDGGIGGSTCMTPLTGVGEALWSYSFPATQEYFLPGDPPGSRSGAELPVHHLTADAERLYVADGQAVTAFDRRTGLGGTPPHKAWRHYYRLPLISESNTREPAPIDLGTANCHVPSLDERSVYTVLGGSTTHELGGQTTLAGKPQLLCLDKATGAQRWLIDVDSNRAQELAGIVFYSTPLPVGERLFILGYASVGSGGATPELICLDRNDGRMIWSTSLPFRLSQMGLRQSQVGQLGTPVPVEAGGWIYVCNHAGSVSAVDAMTGAIRWSASYLERDSSPPTSPRGVLQANTTNPVVLTDGLAVCHAPGSERILALDQVTGEARWGAAERGMRHLYGAAEGRVYASGNFAIAIDARTGKLAWRTSLADQGAGGRGGLTSAGLVVAAGSRITVLDLKNGNPRASFRWSQDRTQVGNLLASGEVLAVANADALTVFRLNPEAASPADAERRVAELGDDDGRVRDRAASALAALCEAGREALTRGLADPNPEIAWRCRLLLERIAVSRQLQRE